MLSEIVPVVVARYPGVIRHLKSWFFKSLDYYQRTLENLVRNTYDGYIGGEFRTILSDLILGQLSDAFETAARDNGLDEVTPRMFDALMGMVAEERSHIEEFYRAIVDARVDGTGVDALLSRAGLWANRYNDAYNEAVRVMTLEFGGRLVWHYGETEHCPECLALNGIVAFASEWEQLGVRPQDPPNDKLTCGGYRCRCSLEPTDRRRSPKAFDTIMNIVAGKG